jgi:hypothetical protein
VNCSVGAFQREGFSKIVNNKVAKMKVGKENLYLLRRSFENLFCKKSIRIIPKVKVGMMIPGTLEFTTNAHATA